MFWLSFSTNAMNNKSRNIKRRSKKRFTDLEALLPARLKKLRFNYYIVSCGRKAENGSFNCGGFAGHIAEESIAFEIVEGMITRTPKTSVVYWREEFVVYPAELFLYWGHSENHRRRDSIPIKESFVRVAFQVMVGQIVSYIGGGPTMTVEALHLFGQAKGCVSALPNHRQIHFLCPSCGQMNILTPIAALKS